MQECSTEALQGFMIRPRRGGRSQIKQNKMPTRTENHQSNPEITVNDKGESKSSLGLPLDFVCLELDSFTATNQQELLKLRGAII